MATLDEVLPAELFTVLLVFVRIGAAMMLLPIYSEPYVTVRMRLLLALTVSLIVSPLIAPNLPAMPESIPLLAILVLGEALIGIFIGSMARMFMAVLSTAGMMMAYMSALANALTNDPSAAQQGSIAGSFLTAIALVTILALNLHHLLLRAVIDSYDLFVPGQVPPLGDFSEMMARVVGQTFQLSLQIAAPFIGVGLIFYLGLGLLGRLMPRVQVFFIAMPLQIAIGLVILFFTLPVIVGWFIGSFEQTMQPFVAF